MSLMRVLICLCELVAVSVVINSEYKFSQTALKLKKLKLRRKKKFCRRMKANQCRCIAEMGTTTPYSSVPARR